jgi:hypothetical protein
MDRIVNLNDERNKLVITVEDKTFEIARVTLAAQSLIAKWMHESLNAYRMSESLQLELSSIRYKDGDDLEQFKIDLRKKADKLQKDTTRVLELVREVQNAAIQKVLEDNGYEYDAKFWAEEVDSSMPGAFITRVYQKDSDGNDQKKT